MEKVRAGADLADQRFPKSHEKLLSRASWLVGVWLAIFSLYFGGTGWAVDRGPINSGETKSASISVPSPTDTWTFSGNKGDRILVTAVTTAGALDTTIDLYPPGGGPLEATTLYGPSYNLQGAIS